jgi:C_GCAxxG_C_C family probable redox protein
MSILIGNDEPNNSKEGNMKPVPEIEKQAAGDKAANYFGNGFHCAEAVATAVIEAIGEDPSEAAAHATAFGGGFGRTYGEACGALSGALIAIGHLHGRHRPGGDWDFPAELGAAVRQQVIDEYGTVHCATLRNRFGDQRQMIECRRLVKKITAALLTLLSANPDDDLER